MLSSTHGNPTPSMNDNQNIEQNFYERNELLTVQDVAELLQVPVSWVYGRTRKRSIDRLPGIRLGKYWRFREAEILAWLKSQAHATRPREFPG